MLGDGSGVSEFKHVRDLVAGDPVAVFKGETCVAISKVTKVTPTGRVVLENGLVFNATGVERGCTNAWRPRTIRYWTEADALARRKDILVRYLESFTYSRGWTELPLEKLEGIVAIAKGVS